MAHRYAIIVAGGRGMRMGADLPKQFLPLRGEPVLMHTLRQFAPEVEELILVLPAEQQDLWRELCAKHHFTPPTPHHYGWRHALRLRTLGAERAPR